MYAIIATGGKQYKVAVGDIIDVEKLDLAINDTVTFDVLLLGGEDGVKAGTPLVEGAKVEGKVLEHGKGKKIVIFKYKAKKGYRRKSGHRQPFTRIEITAFS